MKVTILGTGAWGTALGLVLHGNAHDITLWGHDPANLEAVKSERENKRYLPGVSLPGNWQYETSFSLALTKAEAVVIAIPSRALREVARRLSDFSGLIVSVTKGIEFDSGKTMSRVLRECAPKATVAALSGPSLAPEVARGAPTALVAASDVELAALQTQELFHQPLFRVYTSTDILGVELGGALKNVIAIAAGAGDGLGYGDNSKAALVTRAIVEIRRLGVGCGANAETFAGLSGLGDLTLTCFSKLSRNRTFGERLGRGESLDHIIETSRSVVEGCPTTKAAYQLAQKLKVETPIIDQVYKVLYQGKSAERGVQELLSRSSKAED
jgi:glycerol-3-phosphate dehydrogenase (NAD(P)+)